MAKTRMLKTDLRTSEKVASWPIPLRYFWVLLWGYADDHGKGRDNPLLIKADCFPLDPEVSGEVIDRWMWGLAECGVIARYTVSGVDYFQIVNWREHQKPQHPTADVLPSATAPGSVQRGLHASLMNDSRSLPESRTPELGMSWVEERGGDAQSATHPPLFCSSHPNGSDGPCGRCADARRVYDAWDRGDQRRLAAVPTPRPMRSDELTACTQHKYDLEGFCLLCGQHEAPRAAVAS